MFEASDVGRGGALVWKSGKPIFDQNLSKKLSCGEPTYWYGDRRSIMMRLGKHKNIAAPPR